MFLRVQFDNGSEGIYPINYGQELHIWEDGVGIKQSVSLAGVKGFALDMGVSTVDQAPVQPTSTGPVEAPPPQLLPEIVLINGLKYRQDDRGGFHPVQDEAQALVQPTPSGESLGARFESVEATVGKAAPVPPPAPSQAPTHVPSPVSPFGGPAAAAAAVEPEVPDHLRGVDPALLETQDQPASDFVSGGTVDGGLDTAIAGVERYEVEHGQTLGPQALDFQPQ